MTQFLCKCGHQVSLTEYPNDCSGLFIPEVNLENYYNHTSKLIMEYLLAYPQKARDSKSDSVNELDDSQVEEEGNKEILAEINGFVAGVIDFGELVTVCSNCHRLNFERDGEYISYTLDEE